MNQNKIKENFLIGKYFFPYTPKSVDEKELLRHKNLKNTMY